VEKDLKTFLEVQAVSYFSLAIVMAYRGRPFGGCNPPVAPSLSMPAILHLVLVFSCAYAFIVSKNSP
jgi:hypothetical protein